MTEAISIDIWSDIQCPWCYIGKHRLETALGIFAVTHPKITVQVTYHSFELAPDTPVDYLGTPTEYLMERKGISHQQVQALFEQVTTLAAVEGLEYKIATARQVNTRKAHELLHFALAQQLQVQMKERLLRAYFTDNLNLGDLQVLADLAAEIGLDRDHALMALETGAWTAAVQADIDQAQAYGINGVPFFVIQSKYGISGAQPVEAFVSILDQAAAEKEVL